jgi:antiviral defense system Shedu protein SduA
MSPLEFVDPEEAHRQMLEEDPLGDSFVDWDDVDETDVRRLEDALEVSAVEREMQEFLQAHPVYLIQHLGGGHGRWVIPQKRLGAEYVTDFIIGDRFSGGRTWTAVELEGPQRRMFNRGGDPSQFLWHGIRQIIDWRVWLEYNRDYAARAPAEGGLGLEDISPRVPGLILIGRREHLPEDRRAFRRGLAAQLDIEIHSYDWLLERLRVRVSALARHQERARR